MDLSYGGNGSREAENSNSQMGKKPNHRHSTQQTQRLEAFYKECPHPDKDLMHQLSRALGLDPKQIKFWFQNKRTQMKAQNEKADNNTFRSENEKLHFENLSMQEALKTLTCPSCDGSCGEDEKRNKLQQLRIENMRLKEEHQRAISFLTNYMENPSLPSHVMEHHTNDFPGEWMGPTTLDLIQVPQFPEINLAGALMEIDKSKILEVAIGAFNELMVLMNVNEPVWAQFPADGRYTLHRDSYDKLHPHPNYIKTPSARFESSKYSGEVATTGIRLIEVFLDANKWKDMFPTVVNKARTIEVLDTGILGGSLHLMYEKVHILSPLVAPLEFFFIRYCRQCGPTTWVMVDVSYDFKREVQDAAPTHAWKFPSGCMIEDLSNGKSDVKWIEHIQVDDKSLTHRLYRDLVRTCEAYGAKRWITTLQRMSERFAFQMGPITIPKNQLEGVIDTIEGQRNLMKISHRMVKSFCETLTMSDKLDFAQVSDFENSGVRLSFRKSNEPGQLDGSVLSASASIWLPLPKEELFKFLKDEKNRDKWDVLSSGNPMNAIAHISTGTDPGNCISILQPFVPNEAKMLMLQESSIDSLGAHIIYTMMDLQCLLSVVSGENTINALILPSGYLISGDGKKPTGATSSSNANDSTGSLLTVAFQILVCRGPLTKQLNMDSVTSVHSLITSTIEKIKAELHLSY